MKERFKKWLMELVWAVVILVVGCAFLAMFAGCVTPGASGPTVELTPAPAEVGVTRTQIFAALSDDTALRRDVMEFCRGLMGGGAMPSKAASVRPLAIPQE